jgi:WD40 repeat protein
LHVATPNNTASDDLHKSTSHLPDAKFATDDLLADTNDSELNALLFNNEETILQDGVHDEHIAHQNDSGVKELATLTGHTTKATCCDFSFDGRLLASGGGDKKIFIWDVSPQTGPRGVLEGHSFFVNDVRYAPPSNPHVLASSSFDKTIRIWKTWDLEHPEPCILPMPSGVYSVDFHPMRADVLSSVDQEGDLRFYALGASATCTNFIKKGATKIARFQPHTGRLLATGFESVVRLYDNGNHTQVRNLAGHGKAVHSVAWHTNNSLLTTGSDDIVMVWDINNLSKAVKTFKSDGNKIACCGFHPTIPNVVVIGTYQRMFLWDYETDKNVVVSAHEGVVAGLAVSFATGIFGSASHDSRIKLWK